MLVLAYTERERERERVGKWNVGIVRVILFKSNRLHLIAQRKPPGMV